MDASVFPARAHIEPATAPVRGPAAAGNAFPAPASDECDDWDQRTTITNGRPFSARDGLLEISDEQVFADRNVTYSLLAESAKTGVALSRDAERSIAYIMTHPELPQRNSRISWAVLSEILGADYPVFALRPMYRLGLLTEALPEFRAIDSLVVRDFYHRYTVDEHSLRTIEHLQELGEAQDVLGKPLRAVMAHGGSPGSVDPVFVASRRRQRHARRKSCDRQLAGSGNCVQTG